MAISPDFRDLLMLFAKHRVEFVIVGGYALAHHGAPRYTGDIDLFIRPTEDNAHRVLAALADFGFGSLDITTSDLDRPGRVVQLGYAPCRVDLITSIDGVSFDEAVREPSLGAYGDVSVAFLARDLLIKNKLTSGRAKDLADAEALDPDSAPPRASS